MRIFSLMPKKTRKSHRFDAHGYHLPTNYILNKHRIYFQLSNLQVTTLQDCGFILGIYLHIIQNVCFQKM